MDSRNLQLAHNLINYSVRLQKGEKLLIELIDEGMELAQALIQEAYKVGGIPFLTIKNLKMQRELLLNATTDQMKLCAEYESLRMKNMDAYIAIRGSENVSQLSDVPADKMEIYSKYWMKPVHSDIRVPKTKWCVLRYPNGSMAQLANMSTDAFTDFYYNVCNLDYAKMGKAMRAVSFDTETAQLMGINADRVISFTFGIGSALAAAGGVLVGVYYNSIDPLMGIMPGLKAFVAAVLGGIGSIPGAMTGGIVLGVIEALVSGFISSTFRDAAAFAILILVLLFKPSGIFGKNTNEKV